MLISELIDHMIHVKEEYGDCKVFVLFKSLLEGTVITDVKDTALSRLPLGKDSSEITLILSSCPIIANCEGTREDAERILKGNTISTSKQESSPTPRYSLFIGVEDVVFSLFVETGQKYIDYDKIRQFSYFVQNYQFGSRYKSVVIDLGFDAVERFVQYRVDLVELAHGRLYRKCVSDRFDIGVGNSDIRKLVVEFLKSDENKGNENHGTCNDT